MEKPILFNTEMVQAILEGRKTGTRRVIKKANNLYFLGFTECSTVKKDEGSAIFGTGKYLNEAILRHIKPPYQVGDILYVRETWSFQECESCMGDCDTAPPDSLKGKEGCYVYRTNYGTTEDDSFPPSMFKWHPSIHMPKEAARIFLKVTDVRVERLQDITEEEAIKEGVNAFIEFANLWDSIYAPKGYVFFNEHYGWEENPWVWVIEFERVGKGEKR